MELIRLTKENIGQEHICCAIASERDAQVAAKKAWLAERLDEGLVFLKGDVRGKCMIEYMPAENAWLPIDAPGYMVIDCFWVAGRFAGRGNGARLLDACIEDSRAKGKRGLCVISSRKKRPFLSDGAYLRAHGFERADEAEPYFELLALRLEEGAPLPRFKRQAKHPHASGEGFTLYYTNQCPYTAKYVPLLEAAARERGVPMTSVHLSSAAEAQNAPAAATTFALFEDGAFVTHEILSVKRFEAMLDERARTK